jgi:hypothetical protein
MNDLLYALHVITCAVERSSDQSYVLGEVGPGANMIAVRRRSLPAHAADLSLTTKNKE